MHESKDNAADSVGLMNQVTGSAAFLLYESFQCHFQFLQKA